MRIGFNAAQVHVMERKIIYCLDASGIIPAVPEYPFQ